MTHRQPVIGTAGWSIASKDALEFGPGGTTLERYATRFSGVEINSSFHRSHRPATWTKWEQSVPDDFQSAVKLPKTITHANRLVGCRNLLESFFGEVQGLGSKLGVLLIQLPPSLGFDADVAGPSFEEAASFGPTPIACEPRHPSWFDALAGQSLCSWRVARVAADPARCPGAGEPGGWRGLSYYRLHGSPQIYRSNYDPVSLDDYAARIRNDEARSVWCMFDNTASSAATTNALSLSAAFAEAGPVAISRSAA